MQAACELTLLLTRMTMENDVIEQVISFDALYESMEKCRQGVMWKDSVAHYYLNSIEETLKIEKQLKEGSYRPRKPLKFTVTSPKPREIVSIAFRDRVYQRSLNDNAIYPQISKRFIHGNAACQTGKGTDFARNYLKRYLQKYYRKYGTNGYVLQCDIKGYYPNMRHDVPVEKFRRCLDEWTYEAAKSVLEEQYKGEVGYNPGSQMVQIAGISALDDLDHYIKERLRTKFYLRYMDDFLLIHKDKEYLEECRKKIEEKLKEKGFELNTKKTKIYPIKDGIQFLGFVFRLTETGKVIMTVSPQSVKRERKHLQHLVAKAKRGEITKDKVDFCFAAWKAHAAIGNSYKLLKRMDAYYESLWKEES
jgi:hypothetical protein